MAETVILKFPIKPERRLEFVEVLRGVLPDTRAYAGFVSIEVWLPEDSDSDVVLFERWETREHQAAYFGWRVETGLLEAIGPFMAGEPVVTWMNVKIPN